MTVATIGLGANVGDRKAAVDRAVERLAADGRVRVEARSPYYRTEPWGVVDQDWFVNLCLRVATDLDPFGLLDRCLSVEAFLGRVRGERWGPRTIDLDLLTYGDLVLSDPRLELPHPRILSRAFVLVPLVAVAPEVVVGEGLTAAEALAGLDPAGVEPLPWPVPDGGR